jgi:membrane fusion protein (multidrug efflux system)
LSLIAGFGLSACSKHGQEEQTPTAANSVKQNVIVTTAIEKTVPIYSEFVARTAADQNVDIRARVEGVLEKFSFNEGDFVNKGQVLFTIDKQSLEASVASAQAELDKAQAEVLHAEHQVDLREQQAQLANYQSALVLARQDLGRVTALVNQGAVERRQLDVAIDTEHRALAQVNAQQAKVTNTTLNQKVEMKQAKAHVLSAQASLKQAELSLGYTTIKSPVHGIIGRVEVHPGNLVGRGENTLLATISVVDPIKVDFSIAEASYLEVIKHPDVYEMKPCAELILADNSVHPYKGRLKVLDRAVNSNTGTISIRAEFPNPKAIVRPGQFARIRLLSTKIANAVLIPQRCVQDVQGSKSVLVVDADNKVAQRSVTVGPAYETYFVITDGLKAGEKVILEGLQKVRPGDVVNAQMAP